MSIPDHGEYDSVCPDIHSCSYYCNRPECVLEQRDKLRDTLYPPGQPTLLQVLEVQEEGLAEMDVLLRERDADAIFIEELRARVVELDRELRHEKAEHDIATKFHAVAVKERDYERARVAELETQLSAFPPHSEIDSLRQRVTELEQRLFKHGEMNNPPCFLCGYNGPGYFQPDRHPCAARHHAAAEVGEPEVGEER